MFIATFQWQLAIICFTWQLGSGDAASMNVHSLVGSRVLSYYAGIVPGDDGLLDDKRAKILQAAIEENREAVLGGADFPDFLYACGSYKDHHDAGEAAHWPPFQAAAVLYIQAHWPDMRKWTHETRELVAFFFGVAVHYVTDELWEGLVASLSHRFGFTEMVGAFNLGNAGDGNGAETVTNLAADFYAAWILDEGNISAWKRRLPLEHLVNIYHMTPKTGTFAPNATNFTNVTITSLVECEALFDLGLWALKSFGSLIYPFYNDGKTNHVPLVKELLMEMPTVGMDDIAGTVNFAWARLARWFASSSGPPLAPPRKEVSEMRARAAADDADDRLHHALFHRLKPFQPAISALRQLPEEDAKSYFEFADPEPLTSTWRSESGTIRLRYRGPAELRTTLLDMLNAMAEELLMPRLQLIFVIVDTEEHALPRATAKLAPDAAATARSTLVGTGGGAPVAYFGTSLATGDFDHDGQPDLAIGAEGSGIAGKSPRSGEVTIEYSSGSTSGKQGRTDVLSGGHSPMARFGHSLAVLDFNLDGIHDLVVGAPGWGGWNSSDLSSNPFPYDDEPVYREWGRVFVFFGSKNSGLDRDRPLVVETAKNFTRLGTSLVVGDVTGDGNADLLLGCPSFNGWDGRVMALASTTGRERGSRLSVDEDGVLALDILGPSSQPGHVGAGWFGKSMAVAGNILTVGAPYARLDPNCTRSCEVVGSIYGFELSGSSGSLLAPANAVFNIKGILPLGQLGAAIASSSRHASDDGIVAFSIPGADASRKGQVMLMNHSALAAVKGDTSVTDLEKHAAMITGASEQGRFGTNLMWTTARTETELSGGGPAAAATLIVAAPHQNDGGIFKSFDRREVGAIFVWSGTDLPRLPSSSVTTSSATWTAKGSHPRGRFGVSISVVNSTCLAVGSPRSSSSHPAVMEGNGAVELVCQDMRVPKQPLPVLVSV